ncbi:MAG: diguanylate cyclase [Candidatus Hydrogenedentota bacterium]
MFPWIGGIAGVLAFAALGGYLWFRLGGAYPESTDSRTDGSLPSERPEAETNGYTREVAELEHSKLVIHALLQSVSEGVTTLLGDASNYNDSLERHKNGVKKAMTLAGIQELERVMLHELEQMQETTQSYRKELDKAKAQIQEQRDQLEQLQSDASLDFLTKIPNRRTFDERLREEMSRASRYGSTFSLMVVDVDHFKNINDLHGHQAGDRILRAIAHILAEQRRASDFLARYGGEEFVVLLPETPAQRALNLAEKTRRKVHNARFRYGAETIRVTVSIGVGDFRPGEDNWDSLFARVDQALYGAKRKGRNQVQTTDDS